jgi:hypothetical protein
LSSKILCKTHRNKSAWVSLWSRQTCRESTKTHCDLCLVAKMLIAEAPKTGSRLFLKCFMIVTFAGLIRLSRLQPPKF